MSLRGKRSVSCGYFPTSRFIGQGRTRSVCKDPPSSSSIARFAVTHQPDWVYGGTLDSSVLATCMRFPTGTACRIANIALNDAMILPYNANRSRMEFSGRTAATLREVRLQPRLVLQRHRMSRHIGQDSVGESVEFLRPNPNRTTPAALLLPRTRVRSRRAKEEPRRGKAGVLRLVS
jgi:hypothetical protein